MFLIAVMNRVSDLEAIMRTVCRAEQNKPGERRTLDESH